MVIGLADEAISLSYPWGTESVISVKVLVPSTVLYSNSKYCICYLELNFLKPVC